MLEGSNHFTFWALSSWGDSSLMGTASGNLDSSPPVISGQLTGTAGEGGWYVSEVTVSASASDAVSGVATFEMALDGGGWAAYGGPVALMDGNHTVDLRASDAAGNASTQSQVVRVDTHPPALTLSAEASFCPGCGEELGIDVDIQDLGSGVAAWTQAAIDLAERWLNLERLELQVHADNAPAIRLYEKFGFAIEGTLLHYAFRDGQYMDAYAMARLRK